MTRGQAHTIWLPMYSLWSVWTIAGAYADALLVGAAMLGRSQFGLRLAFWRSPLREYNEAEQDQPIGDRERP
jgi:hypothetical protein